MSEVLGHHRQRRQTNRHPFSLQNVEKIQEEKNSVRLFLNIYHVCCQIQNCFENKLMQYQKLSQFRIRLDR